MVAACCVCVCVKVGAIVCVVFVYACKIYVVVEGEKREEGCWDKMLKMTFFFVCEHFFVVRQLWFEELHLQDEHVVNVTRIGR